MTKEEKFDLSKLFVGYESLDFFRYMPGDLRKLPRMISLEYAEGNKVIKVASSYVEDPICHVYAKWKEDNSKYCLIVYIRKKTLKSELGAILRMIAFAEHELLISNEHLMSTPITVELGYNKKNKWDKSESKNISNDGKVIIECGTLGYWHNLIFN